MLVDAMLGDVANPFQCALDRLRDDDRCFLSQAGRVIQVVGDEHAEALVAAAFPLAGSGSSATAIISPGELARDDVADAVMLIVCRGELGVPGYVLADVLGDDYFVYAAVAHLAGDALALAAERLRVRSLTDQLELERRRRIGASEDANRVRAVLEETERQPLVNVGTDEAARRRSAQAQAEFAALQARHDAVVGSKVWRYSRRPARLMAQLRALRKP